MNRLFSGCLVLMVAFLAAGAAAGDAVSGEYEFYDKYLAYKLGIGTRIKHFSLLDDTRGKPRNGSFFGTITQIREDQNYAPLNLYAEYRILPCFGVGIGFDKLSIEAGDWGVEGSSGGGTDGTLEMSGALLYLFGRYTNTTIFTPFCELGGSLYSASFEASPEWGESGLRHVSLDGTTGYFAAIGCEAQLWEYVSLDIYARYMHIGDVEGGWYTGYTMRGGDVVLTPSYMSYGIGAKFVF